MLNQTKNRVTSAVKDQQIALVTFAQRVTAEDSSIRFPMCAAKTSFAPAQPIARIATEPVRYSDMPRNMSFALTRRQFEDGSKDVTRRLGWLRLKPGEIVCPVAKCMGLKPGEKIERLGGLIRVQPRRELLRRMIDEPQYGRDECLREGFPEMSPEEFVAFFCKTHRKCTPDWEITRVEFARLEQEPEEC